MSNDTLKALIKAAGIISALYLFLVGIAGMSSAIKSMGSQFAETVLTTTSNPFIALFIGIFATVLFQSSSTTTSLIVGMVSSGTLTITNSIPMIMGANIGTTVTNTIVSIGHIKKGTEFKRAFAASTVHDFFNILSVILFLPLECITHFIYHWSKLLTNLMDDYEGGTFKSPLKIIVSPLIKLIIQVDKKKIKKISQNELNRKTIEIFNDIKVAKRFCRKEQKVIKVPNTDVFKIAAPILISRGISRIVSSEQLISL